MMFYYVTFHPLFYVFCTKSLKTENFRPERKLLFILFYFSYFIYIFLNPVYLDYYVDCMDL